MTGIYLDIFKVFVPTLTAFVVGISLTPVLTHYLYKHKLWKKKAGKISPDGQATPVFDRLHKDKEVGTPRMGGVVIWSSVLITITFFWLISILIPESDFWIKLNFLSRNQTWLPLFTLIVASLLGLADDWLQVSSTNKTNEGLPFNYRLLVVGFLGLVGGWWFFAKLGMTEISLPFFENNLYLGWLIIPLFIIIMLALFSSGVIDGLDGLSGGIMSIIFFTYAALAFFQTQVNLATFCAVVGGAILAFLWFNIPPARFYMSETGILGLTTALTVVVFLTDSVLLLPIIALPLVVTSGSVVIQMLSKKMRHGKKIFKIAPLHHHFEAIGWPAYKVVMRYWLIGIIAAIIGLILALIS
ncbi:MAG: hypothetical protein ACOCU8_00335 [Patescibacteria group bacterium]